MPSGTDYALELARVLNCNSNKDISRIKHYMEMYSNTVNKKAKEEAIKANTKVFDLEQKVYALENQNTELIKEKALLNKELENAGIKIRTKGAS